MNLAVPTVSMLQVANVVGAFYSLGLDVPRILAQASIEREDLRGAERLATQLELRLWEAAVVVSGDGALGLRVAQQLAAGAMGSFEYLLRHSQTLEELLTRAQRYGRLLDDLMDIRLDREGGVATIRLGRVANYPVSPAGAECLFSVALTVVRTLWPGVAPLGVHFFHQRNADMAIYTKHFGCQVHFEHPANEVLFAEPELRSKSVGVDENLGKILEEHTAALLGKLPAADSVTDVARYQLGFLLADSRLAPSTLARALGLSERTLRRKLAAEGTSYQLLLDELRRNLALARAVHSDKSFEALAAELGFADTSTFYRAFKRWTGTTPAKYRERT